MSALDIVGKVVEIGLPLVKSLVALIGEAIGAPQERTEAILRRLEATKAALDASAEEAHTVHDSEHAATVAVLDAIPPEEG